MVPYFADIFHNDSKVPGPVKSSALEDTAIV